MDMRDNRRDFEEARRAQWVVVRKTTPTAGAVFKVGAQALLSGTGTGTFARGADRQSRPTFWPSLPLAGPKPMSEQRAEAVELG